MPDTRYTEWFRKAEEQGHAEAQYNLGALCLIGRGVPKGERRAAEWFGRAAAQGHPDAKAALGIEE